MVPAAKHNQSVVIVPEQYAARTTAFFRKHLAGEAIQEAEIVGAEIAGEGLRSGVA